MQVIDPKQVKTEKTPLDHEGPASICDEKKPTYWGLLFKNQPFRLCFSSYVITIAGDYFTYVASMEIIERLLGQESQSSRVYISILHVTKVLPHFLLFPFSGVLADAWDRRKSMIILDIMGAVAPLFYIVALHYQSIEIVHLACLLQSSIAAMYEPCRSAIIPLMVKHDEDMKKATVLMEQVWGVMSATGSGLGGYVVSLFGVRACFALDSISFFCSALCLFSIGGSWDVSAASTSNLNSNDQEEQEFQELQQHVSLWEKTKDMAINGVKYISSSPFWPIIFIKCTDALVYGASDTLNVSFSESYIGTTEGEQSQMLGALFFSIGVGYLVGPLISEAFFTSISQPISMLNACVVSFAIQAIGHFGLGYFASFGLKLLFSAIRASGMAVGWTESRVLIQILVSETMLGRVTAIDRGLALLAEGISAIVTGIIMDSQGLTASFASFLIGALASFIFAIWTCYISCCLGGNGVDYFAFSSSVNKNKDEVEYEEEGYGSTCSSDSTTSMTIHFAATISDDNESSLSERSLLLPTFL